MFLTVKHTEYREEKKINCSIKNNLPKRKCV